MDYCSPQEFVNDVPRMFEQFRNSGADTLCLTGVREALHVPMVNAKINALANMGLLTDQVRFIFNNTLDTTLLDNRHLMSRVDNIDFFLCYTLYKTIFAGAAVNQCWNKDSNKTLFLLGKPDKNHRLPVLCHLSQRPEIMENLVYSFDPCLEYPDQPSKDFLANVVNLFREHFPDIDYKSFANQYAQNLDIFDPSVLAATQNSYPFQGHTGFPFDPSFYSDTVFSVVSETGYGRAMIPTSPGADIWTTEKTWRAIVNRHPFVLFDHAGTIHRYLNSLGIKTFEKFYLHGFDITGASSQPTVHARLFADNAAQFSQNIAECTDEVQQMIDHNYDAAIELYEQYVHRVFSGNHENFMNFVDRARYPDWQPTL